jgi:hypothetical protein
MDEVRAAQARFDSQNATSGRRAERSAADAV